MQFIPSTWKQYASDGNGDGKSDPQNAYDAAMARYTLIRATAAASIVFGLLFGVSFGQQHEPIRGHDDCARGPYCRQALR